MNPLAYLTALPCQSLGHPDFQVASGSLDGPPTRHVGASFVTQPIIGTVSGKHNHTL